MEPAWMMAAPVEAARMEPARMMAVPMEAALLEAAQMRAALGRSRGSTSCRSSGRGTFRPRMTAVATVQTAPVPQIARPLPVTAVTDGEAARVAAGERLASCRGQPKGGADRPMFDVLLHIARRE